MSEYRFICDKNGCTVQVKRFIFWAPIAKNQTVIEAQTIIKNLRIIAVRKIDFTKAGL